jgi:uncharacterized protein with GYD domain
MAKYLVSAKYTAPEGVKGLIADGGTARAAAVSELIASIGGKVEAFYYAFGEVDAFAILDMPDANSAVATSLAVNASGLATISLTELLTPEQIDTARQKIPAYDAPGPSA